MSTAAGTDPSQPSVVVVGASLAGGTVAQTLREDGFTGRIVLIGSEPHLPYERPPLSKGYLLGTAERDVAFLHPTPWYAEQDIELWLGRTVTAIDRDAHEVVVDGSERLAYTSLVLATGSRPRLIDVPGSELSGVRYLRTIDDADGLLEAFTHRPRVAVIGGGWIGLEVAAAAREHGLDVTVLEVGALPLVRVLGPQVAQIFADLHREHGVDLRTEVQVTALTSDDGTSVSGVRLADGAVVPAELVVVGVGITPQVELAEAAGLAVDNGVVVDEHLRTADPHVLAVGDVARARHTTLGIDLRVEHWANAQRHGAVAAKTIEGVPAADERLPYFFTDQYDLGMEYVGYVPDPAAAEVVIRGDVGKRELIVFWLDGDRVLAGMNVNVWDVTEDIEALIRAGAPVDRARLADPDVPLTEVAAT
jgi:3-phenylpropionate/trans-cinnamate dioxygenase ferredoxin reductase subunit